MNEMIGIKSKVLGDLQDNMAKRRLLKITVDLDKGTIKTEGGGPEQEEPGEPAEPDSAELGAPKDVVSRLRKLA